MQSILKTFRLPISYAQFLEESASEKNISQTEVILKSLSNLMKHKNRWQQDLSALTEDKEYRKEQIDLAEEYYE